MGSKVELVHVSVCFVAGMLSSLDMQGLDNYLLEQTGFLEVEISKASIMAVDVVPRGQIEPENARHGIRILRSFDLAKALMVAAERVLDSISKQRKRWVLLAYVQWLLAPLTG